MVFLSHALILHCMPTVFAGMTIEPCEILVATNNAYKQQTDDYCSYCKGEYLKDDNKHGYSSIYSVSSSDQPSHSSNSFCIAFGFLIGVSILECSISSLRYLANSPIS